MIPSFGLAAIESSAKRTPCPEDMLSYCGLGDCVHHRHLRRRDASYGHQIEAGPLHRRERFHGAFRRRGIQTCVQHRFRPRRRRLAASEPSPEVQQTRPPQIARPPVARQPSDDREEPGRKRTIRIKPARLLMDDHERLLRHVFRIGAAAQDLRGQQRRRPDVTPDEHGECGVLAGCSGREQRRIRSFIIGHAPPRRRVIPSSSGARMGSRREHRPWSLSSPRDHGARQPPRPRSPCMTHQRWLGSNAVPAGQT
jgi:hypothetical protein